MGRCAEYFSSFVVLSGVAYNKRTYLVRNCFSGAHLDKFKISAHLNSVLW